MNRIIHPKVSTLLFVLLMYASFVYGQVKPSSQDVVHTIYSLGNYGNHQNSTPPIHNLNALQNSILKDDTENTTVLFLGDNTSIKGYPTDTPSYLSIARQNLDQQLEMLSQFKGNAIFIPGNHDWESGLAGLKSQRKYVNSKLGKGSFLPKGGCGMERLVVNDFLDIVIIDSQWAIMDWDKYPGINKGCDIKTKEEFYVEVEKNIQKGEGKTVVVAMHHPAQNYGKYGARLSFGIDPQDLSNPKYKEFSERLRTIARQVENVIFLSAHDNSLQFIGENQIPSIISGTGSRPGRVPKAKEGFASPNVGFSKLSFYNDGSVWLSFFDRSNNYVSSVYEKEIRAGRFNGQLEEDYNEYESPQYVKASIYNQNELKRSPIYKALWGAHYRQDYLTKVEAKTALLDTLYGGLRPLRKGGGHQTNSLRLINRDGREFAMRSVKKSALRFIQYFLFKTEYLDPEIEETYFVQLLQDYWTTANPYGLLTIGDLSDALGILHPNPKLYFVPKQKALGSYNENYGDKLYFIEERLTKGQEDVKTLGESDKIISTLKLFDELRDKEALKIDEQLYIRTRIFDNLIGDWDRHADQWKWAKYKRENDSTFYRPIPRDRDQVYSDFDGFILRALTALTPPLRFMQRYDGTYNHVRWYNDAGDDVDLAVLKNHTREDWIREAKYVKEHLTPEIIDLAFEKIPKEMNQSKIRRIRKALATRLENIEENAINMFAYLSRYILVTGTDERDLFEITRLPNGNTHIAGFHFDQGIKDGKFWDVTYEDRRTSEIWLYGLDGDDKFVVKGNEPKNIHVKIIGGYGNDIYEAQNNKGIKVYDHKTKRNTFNSKIPKMLSDNSDMNTYFFMRHRRDLSQVTPLFGFDPDDGLGLGFQYNYQKNSLVRNPFTDNHQIGLTYFFQTRSIEASYSGEFAHIFNRVNFGLDIDYSSPSYTDNFFGFGNDTPNFDDDLGIDFNRVRIQKFSIKPSLIYRGFHGSKVGLGINYEFFEVEETEGRFITQVDLPENTFDRQSFLGIEFNYSYDNLAGSIISKSGIGWGVKLGYKSNLGNGRGYAYSIPHVRIAAKLDKKGTLVVASKIKSQINFGNNFEFYQAATIGDRDGLRGFRQQRFSGKRSLAHSSDLRLSLGRLRNGILPIGMGIYGGFDYGRVWVSNDNSNIWHTSYGGGAYFSLGGFSAFNLAYFGSDDGGRVTFGLSLPF